VTATRTTVAIGDSAPAASAAGLVLERGEIVEAGQAHDLPARTPMRRVGLGVRTRHLAGALGRIVEQPAAHPAATGARFGVQYLRHPSAC
jgi:hypothetical protein